MDELIEQMAARSPAGPPCPTCGHQTRLVVYGEQWCSRCRLLRPYAEDPRIADFASREAGPDAAPAASARRGTRAA